MASIENVKVLSVTVASSIFAETSTFPLDLVKTRLQLQGDQQRIKSQAVTHQQLPKNKVRIPIVTEVRKFGTLATGQKALSSIKDKNIFKTLSDIHQSGGVRGFYRGLAPALMRHAVYSGTRVSLYEFGREKLYKINEQRYGPGHHHLTTSQAIVLAAASGFTAQAIANPTDLLKVRLQSGEYSTLRQAYNSVPNFKAFWNGVGPNLGRAVMVNQGDLMTYDRLKTYLLLNTSLTEGSDLHFLASFGSGLVACTLAMPFDTVKSRIMNQPVSKTTGKGMYYKSMGQAFRLIVRNEGFFSLYRGFFAAWPRMAIWSQCFWHFNENIRSCLEMKPF